MRNTWLLLASVPWCLAPQAARAQVSVDPHALDQLTPPPTEAPAPNGRPVPHTPRVAPAPSSRNAPARGTAPADRADRGRPGEAYGPPRPPAAATVPTAAPPGPAIPPPIAVPTRPVPPPAPVPIVADAPGEAAAIKDGLRITFGADGSELNKQTDAAVQTFVHTVPPFDTTIFTISSYAAAQPDDPSTPRRLALSRALAIRSVLIAEGVTSPRIIVRVLGATATGSADDPPDRVDIVSTTPDPGRLESGRSGAAPAPAPPAAAASGH